MGQLLSLFDRTRISRSSWTIQAALRFALLCGFVLVPAMAPVARAADSDGEKSKDEANEIATVGTDNAEPIELSGQVRDAKSMPAANVPVRIEGFSSDSFEPWTATIKTDEQGKFKVRLRIKPDRLRTAKMFALTSDKSQIGVFRFPWANKPTNEPIKIQLGAAREIRLKVVNADGTAENAANTSCFLSQSQIVDTAVTGADGIAKFIVPANEKISTVVAWKNDAGLDYRIYDLPRGGTADSSKKSPEFPQSGMQTLVLEGATPMAVKLSDEDGAPIKNAGAYPWLLKKESEPDELNLSFFMPSFVQKTNQEGIANIRWMPVWQTKTLTLWPVARGYDRQRGKYTPGKDEIPLKFTLKKNVSIRGRVREASGAPSANVEVNAYGAGYSFDRGRDSTLTDQNGNYELLVPPDQIYLVTAAKKGKASSPQSGFAALSGHDVEGKDFLLRPATRVFGKLIDEESQKPVAKTSMIVIQYGQDLASVKDVSLPNPDNNRVFVQPTAIQSTQTDENGLFEFFVGDGQFDIQPPQQEKAVKFQVAGEAEVELTVKTRQGKDTETKGAARETRR